MRWWLGFEVEMDRSVVVLGLLADIGSSLYDDGVCVLVLFL